MILQLRRRTPLLLSVAAAVMIMSATGGAMAARSSVSLEFKGQFAKQHHSACGRSKRFRMFHRSSTIEFRGFLTPPSAKHFAVRLRLERCVRGHWRRVGDRFTRGKRATGKYKGYFAAGPLAPRSHRHRATVYYRGVTRVGTVRSTEEYFGVTG